MSTTRYLHLMKALLLLLIASAAVALLIPHPVQLAPLPSLSGYQCRIAQAQGDAAFRVYMPVDWQAEALAEQLCQQGLKGSAYGRVEVSWAPRDTLRSGALLSHDFQLLWDREHVLSGLLPDFGRLYQVLKPMPDYEIDWFSQRPGLVASAAYFRGQRIGLLADSRSQSGYQLPRLQLAALGVDEADVRYFPNRSELMGAFLQGQLDLMPGLPVQLPDWPADQRLLLTDHAPIGSWYVAAGVAPDLHCRLLAGLAMFDRMVAQLSRHPVPAEEECGV
ncbi:hypothetical protein ACQUQU_15210 [Thalassolituus sp. LLYu03]|uniref:hypothetical protein n=1 Tax=Thalassolituus sp. LLYu03 TaxID=3421656 RepID=UPI003D27A906